MYRYNAFRNIIKFDCRHLFYANIKHSEGLIFNYNETNKVNIRHYAMQALVTHKREDKTFNTIILSRMQNKYNLTNEISLNKSTDPGELPYTADIQQSVQHYDSMISLSHEPSTSSVLNLFRLYTQCGSFILRRLLINPAKGVDRNQIDKKIIDSVLVMNHSELYQLAVYLKRLTSLKFEYFNKFLEVMARECIERSNEVPIHELILNMIILSTVSRNGLYGTDHFKMIEKLYEQAHEADPSQACQILHFISLTKKKMKHDSELMELVEKLSPFIDTLSFEEIGIACGALFKLGVKLDRRTIFVTKIAKCLEEKLSGKDLFCDKSLNSYATVSIVKLLNMTRFYNQNLLNSMTMFLESVTAEDVTAEFISHIIAMYASSDIYDEKAFKICENIYCEKMTSKEQSIRLKDVSKVMWSFSHVRHSCSPECLKITIETLNEYNLLGELVARGHFYIDSLLSLLILEADVPQDLISRAFHPSVVKNLTKSNASKRLSRLANVQVACKYLYPKMELLNPDVYKDLPQRSMELELKYRSSFPLLAEAVRLINQRCGYEVLKFKFLVQTIMFASIVPCSALKEFNSDDSNTLQLIDDEINNNDAKLNNTDEKINSNDAKLTDEKFNNNVAKLTDDKMNNNDTKSNNYIEDETCTIGNELLSNIKNIGKVTLEIDDENSTVKNINRLNGLEFLKRKLLQLEGWDVRVIQKSQVEACKGDTAALAALILIKLQ